MSYDEHLISMAGGDGDKVDQLAAIEARYEAAQQALANDQRLVSIRQLHRLSESANDVPALLAHVRELQAVIAKLSDWAGKNRVGYYDEAQDDVVQIIRAALTATEER